MALSDAENTWLSGFFERVEDSNLSDWETGFVADQEKRYKEYGANVFMSPRQWDVLFRVAVKKMEYDLPEGRDPRDYEDRR